MTPLLRDDSPGDGLAAQLTSAERAIAYLLDALADIARGEADPLTIANTALAQVRGEPLSAGTPVLRLTFWRDGGRLCSRHDHSAIRSPFDTAELRIDVAEGVSASALEALLNVAIPNLRMHACIRDDGGLFPAHPSTPTKGQHDQ